MSKFIQVPIEIISKLTSRCKYNEAFVYAAIRSQIKDGTRTASYPMADLAKLCNVDERTIYNYINRLICVGLFSLLENKKKQLKGDHRYNVYLFPYIKDNCMLIDPSFIEDKSFTTEEKGVMFFIKANCDKGTNHFHFKSMAELKAKIGVGKNSNALKVLQSKGYVKIISNAIIITCDAFPLYLNGKPEDYIYETIYNYCLYKGIIPPIKNSKSLFLLKTKYIDGKTGLVEDLLNKCKNLPNEVSLDYFSKALVNMIPEKKPQPQYFTM